MHTQGVAAGDQHIAYGEAAYTVRDDVDLRALVLTHDDHHQPTLHVMRRQDLMAWREETTCTRVFLGSDRPVIQPIYVLPGSDKGVCHGWYAKEGAVGKRLTRTQHRC